MSQPKQADPRAHARAKLDAARGALRGLEDALIAEQDRQDRLAGLRTAGASAMAERLPALQSRGL